MSLTKFAAGVQFDWSQPDRILHKWYLPIDQYLLRPIIVKSSRKLFTPQEVSVVERKHEDLWEGFIGQHFLKKHPISERHDKRDVCCNLFIDGFLTLVVPKTQSKKEDEGRVPSTTTGPPQRPGTSKSDEKTGKKKEKDAKNA